MHGPRPAEKRAPLAHCASSMIPVEGHAIGDSFDGSSSIHLCILSMMRYRTSPSPPALLTGDAPRGKEAVQFSSISVCRSPNRFFCVQWYIYPCALLALQSHVYSILAPNLTSFFTYSRSRLPSCSILCREAAVYQRL
jgi:hypothetical protein